MDTHWDTVFSIPCTNTGNSIFTASDSSSVSASILTTAVPSPVTFTTQSTRASPFAFTCTFTFFSLSSFRSPPGRSMLTCASLPVAK